MEFNNESRPKTKEGKMEKRKTFESATALYEGRELTFNAFKSKIFLLKGSPGKRLKKLTCKGMLQRSPIALVQLDSGNTSENLLNEIRKITYSLYQAKEII